MENDKLVRLSDVIKTIENQCSYGNMWGNENLTLIDAYKTVDELSDLPAVDAVVVRHGRWVEKPHKMMGTAPACSECGGYNPIETKYCPNCGAKMDGGKHETD